MNGNMIPEGWKENFRMSERSFYILCEKLRPYIQKQTTRFSKLISVEKQVASTLYYVSDEGRLRKVAMHLAFVNQLLLESFEELPKQFQSFYLQNIYEYFLLRKM